MMKIIIIEFIIYCIAIIGIGYYFSKRSKTQSDFLLGGKKLPGWALAFSERATGESAWLLLGYTGFVFMTGLSGIWVAAGIASGIIFSWLFLAKRFMKETDKYSILTLPDYLAVRFGKKANIIRWLTSLLIAGFLMFYVGAQMAGAGKMLFITFEWTPTTGIILATIVIIIIAFAGGFISVVWTDMIQSVMMVITLVALPIVAFFHLQSNDISISQSLVSAGSSFNSWFGGLTGFALGVLFFNNFAWFFGFLGGQPQLSARFMALKNDREAKHGSIVAVVWTFLAYGGAFLIGLCAIAMYDQGSFGDVEVLLPTMILQLMPPWIAGLLLAGVLAAIITTANSQLLVVTGSISEDIIHKAIGIKLTDKQLVWLSRIMVVLFGLIGMIIALVSESLLYLVVGWAWAGVGCTLSPAILMTFFWKRYSGAGVIATVVSGLLSTVLWISTPLEEMITSRFTTFFIALFFGIVFSLLFPDKKEKTSTSELTDEKAL
ncbi:sodium/solute symporter [Virgibacillus halodenitrificans]|nr:sodium/proline symporter [Virgibacillus halodenitrificans]MCG1029830.1 sodium/proline symporter [Virgibacillus halodenitrificans]MEC2159091.1 sodium/proline symporter [Virgibacillus halodenitrificans]MYL47321.1 sodium/solute symporter [Virgibacillus halodenitrificans]MYL56962.1 sodium/solute symporter [Virgibacillus halodenitrificans]